MASNKRREYVGFKHGVLEVISLNPQEKGKYGEYWDCKCVCGRVITLPRGYLRKVKSCGCTSKKRTQDGLTTLGHGIRHPINMKYRSMLGRCRDPKDKNYGGRGIKVLFKSYKEFYYWSLSNGWREGLTIDRINPNGHYAPWNCRWIERKEQSKNKRTSVFIEVEGKILHILDAISLYSPPEVHYKVVKWRVKKGWEAMRALTEPIGKTSFRKQKRKIVMVEKDGRRVKTNVPVEDLMNV